MAESKITLYTRAIGFEAEKLFMIEDIESYLTEKEPNAPTTTIQYQKIELKKYIKVILDEVYSEPLKANNYVYCKIENLDNPYKYMYYWIKKLNWKSQNCIELDLILDTLNTFKIGTDYTFSPKTIIQRQHKDRMEYRNNASFHSDWFENWDYQVEPPFPPEADWHNYVNKDTYHVKFNLFREPQNQGYDYLEFFNSNHQFLLFYLTIIEKSSGKVVLPNYKCRNVSVINDEDGDEVALYLNENNIFRFKNVGNANADYDFYIQVDGNAWDGFICDDAQLTDDIFYYESDFFQKSSYGMNELCEGTMRFIRKVDLLDEQLNPQLYGKFDKKLEDSVSRNTGWNIVYDTETTGDVSRVIGNLIPDDAISVNVASLGLSGNQITPDLLSEGYFYHILLKNITDHSHPSDPYFNNPVAYGRTNFTLDDGSPLPYDSDYDEVFLELQKIGNKIFGSVVEFKSDGNAYFSVVRGLSFTTSYLTYTGSETSITYGRDNNQYANTTTAMSSMSRNLCNGNSWGQNPTRLLNAYSDLQRYHSTMVRSIKIPYFPFNFNVDDEERPIITSDLLFRTSWKGLANSLAFNTENIEMDHHLIIDLTSPTNRLYIEDVESVTSETPHYTLNVYPQYYNEFIANYGYGLPPNRNDEYESKMLHSEFFYDKFTYDSFAYIYKFELIDIDNFVSKYHLASFDIDVWFHVTNTMNSRFAFEFTDFITSNHQEQDFDNWLIISRNNENVLFTTAYLQYLQSGYNYDVKNKEAQNTRNWILATGSIIGTIASAVSAVATGGASIPLAVGMAVSTVGTLTNAITTQGMNERSLQQKLDTLKIQSASVSGADDVDLMEKYGKNRLLHFTYETSERMQKLLKDLFYYYGYREQISGIPQLNTRTLFNYLKCEPLFDFTSLNITDDIENELKAIMRTGFTLIHKYTYKYLDDERIEKTKSYWDVDQTKENIEVSILPYLM